MLVLLAHRSGGVDQVLGDEEYSFQYLWVLVVEEVTAGNEVNQLVHKTVKMIWESLCTVVDHSGEGSHSRTDKMWNTFTLTISQVLNHHWQQVVSWYVQSKELGYLVSPLGNLWFLIKNILVYHSFENLGNMWFDLCFDTDNDIV